MTGERNRVVITAIGLATPLGLGKDAFWENLIGGVSGARLITLFDPSNERVQIAAEVDFEPRRFLDFKDAKRFARVAQLAIVAAELALADQGLDGIDREEFATVVSSGLGGPDAIQSGVDSHIVKHEAVSPLFIPMAMANLAASVIAHRYGFAGPSYAPVSACASSADAIGQGFRLVRDGYASACFAGGAEAPINPVVMSGFASMRALSRHNEEPARAARPFSGDRDGFVLGEGAGIVLLESLASARARGARIYAEVVGYGQTSDAYHLTAPRPEGERVARAMRLALREAGLDAAAVQYVNAHGTGTLLSDPAETKSLHLAFGEHAKKLAVSSTKAMTGHLLGAAGAVEAAVCALAIERGMIPPTINLHVPDPVCDLDYVPNQARAQRVDVALTNSQAFGGHNTSLLLKRLEP